MLKIFFSYLWYRIFASHRKGYGIHSPFVFDLITNVLLKTDDEGLTQIKGWRRNLSHRNDCILTEDEGAGSKVHRRTLRSVKTMLRRSSIRHKYGRFLYYLTLRFKPATILELGTGIGISTAYFMKAQPDAKIITIDADRSKLDNAEKNLMMLKMKKPELCHGSFDEFLLSKLNSVKHPLMVFIDGDHRYESVIRYFEHILQYVSSNSIIVIDDLRWSDGMRKAWELIKNDQRTVLCIDLFFIGLIFFRDGMLKQNYVINL